jgi:hypothetical protein
MPALSAPMCEQCRVHAARMCTCDAYRSQNSKQEPISSSEHTVEKSGKEHPHSVASSKRCRESGGDTCGDADSVSTHCVAPDVSLENAVPCAVSLCCTTECLEPKPTSHLARFRSLRDIAEQNDSGIKAAQRPAATEAHSQFVSATGFKVGKRHGLRLFRIMFNVNLDVWK